MLLKLKRTKESSIKNNKKIKSKDLHSFGVCGPIVRKFNVRVIL